MDEKRWNSIRLLSMKMGSKSKAMLAQLLLLKTFTDRLWLTMICCPICRYLPSNSIKQIQSWGCVAGSQQTLAYSIHSEHSEQYLVVKLNQLVVILFKMSTDEGSPI